MSVLISACPTCRAAEDLNLDLPDQRGPGNFDSHRINDGFRVRGFEVAPRTYVGSTKLDGKWGVGLMVDGEKYAYGVNDSGVSLMLKFK